jgi:hypothetical protein
VALVVLGACSQAPAPPAAKLWTLFDVEAKYASGAGVDTPLAADAGLPGGIPLKLIATPAPDGSSTLDVRTAWSNSDLVAFLTTEVWNDYSEVWMQPAYVPITGWVDGQPQLLGGGPLRPIFSVGAASAFYSPFWQLVYAEVPADTAPDALTSVRQILDGGYVLTPGEGRTMPLVPPNVGLPSSVELPVGGFVDLPLGVVGGTGFFSGETVSYLDFGPSLFTWDPNSNVVQEASIYVLTFIGPGGKALASPSIPTILGAGPPGSGVTLPGGAQRNSAYYRVHTVVLPNTARVYAPPGSAVYDGLPDDLKAFSGYARGASVAQNATFSGRVALNPGDPAQGVSGCFDDPALLAHNTADPTSCTWLGSEAALKANLDLSTEETTSITVTWEVTDLLKVNQTDGSVTAVPGPVEPL